MKRTTRKRDSVLWIEASGFSFVIGLSWLVEALRLPAVMFGESFEPNWKRAILRTVVLLMIWGWVHLVTRRLLKRLRYLEEFLRVCAWCRKVCDHGRWMTMEEYFDSKFDVRTTHGVCPACRDKRIQELGPREDLSSIPE